ncbi:type IA DNA topoisomerase [Apilactobacillus timberlakei]|uniref:DNA topoisomerase n=1 Tax=Apilactobacillus timberlakei TaxID=2008380 RepID=UPI0011278942|nr:DNA topoisomerase [Apilactobacillus timberlakei]TPR14973.1 type IA DNA topoisomerase [Apilactobacillus timberlakei]
MLFILAEKKDQAETYAEALKGDVSRKNRNIISVNGSSVLSNHTHIEIGYLQGHLYELKKPEDYDEKFKKWSLDNLPIFPKKMEFNLKKGFSTRRDDIAEAIEQSDDLWLATDSDVEGESLGYIFLQKIGASNKITGRVWIDSLTLDGLAKAFQNVRDPKETIGKAHAGFCRMAGDWLIGMNYSPLSTILLQNKGFQDMKYFPVGRVQTPLVKLIANRRLERANFKPVTTYRLKFTDENGVVSISDKERPFKTKAEAEKAVDILSGNYPPKIVQIEKSEKSRSAPTLYKLGDLQGIMNEKHGVPTDKVEKDIAENLYKDYHLTSYPRTDSSFLTTDDFNEIISRKDKYADFYKRVTGVDISYLLNNLSPRNKYVDKNGKKIKKAGGHHGLAPNIPISKENLVYLKNEGAEPTINFDEIKGVYKIAYFYILSTALAIMADDYKYHNTSIESNAGGMKFTTSINERISTHSFKDILDNEVSLDENDNLVVTPNEAKKEDEDIANVNYEEGNVLQGKFSIKEENTTPPKPITESNIVRTIMPKYSLGTQATRGGIINNIREVGLVELSKKANKKSNLSKNEFIPTDKAIILLEFLSKSKILDFSQVKLWEDKMNLMSSNQGSSKGFIDDIKNITMEDINTLQNGIDNIQFTINPEEHKVELAKDKEIKELDVICPKCKKGNLSLLSYEKYDKHHELYIHDTCKFVLPTRISSVNILPEEISKIIDGTYPRKEFVSKENKKFSARLKYSKNDLYFIMAKEFEETFELTCPKCKKSKIGLEFYKNKKDELKHRYSCTDEECSFSCPKKIAKLDISLSILKDILANEQKEYDFTSKKGNTFKASLIYKAGKVEMVFLQNIVESYNTPCPLCSKGLLLLTSHKYQEKDLYNFACSDCNLSIPQTFVGKTFNVEEIMELIKNKTGKYTFYSQKKHKNFDATLEFHPKAKEKLKFKKEKSKKKGKSKGLGLGRGRRMASRRRTPRIKM